VPALVRDAPVHVPAADANGRFLRSRGDKQPVNIRPLEIIPGIYEYKRTIGDYKNRIHLRLEDDGHGVLLINANQLFHFNPSAALMAFYILEEANDDVIIKKLRSTFHSFQRGF